MQANKNKTTVINTNCNSNNNDMVIKESNKKCAVCSTASSLTCSNCNKINYCSKDCQKQDWKTHKQICTPYSIAVNDNYGRYLVSTKDLKAGQLLLKESPLVVGPSVNSIPLCLNCYKPISIASLTFCTVCNVAPLCHTNCTKVTSTKNGHNEQECHHFKINPYITGEKLFQHYQVITPLRCLLLRKTNPSAWNELLQMEAHLNSRRNTPIWRNYKLNVESVLHKFNLLSEEDIRDELIQKICGILDVNIFEMRVPGIFEMNDNLNHNRPINECCVRGIFLQAAMMAHDCIGNTHLAVDDFFQMTVHASVPIKQNSPIYFNYANALQGTYERQQHLQQGKYFNCTCNRCLDVTECETHISSITCVKCKRGYVIPEIMVNIANKVINTNDIYKHDFFWKCSEKNCQYKYRGSMIESTINCATQIVEETDKTSLTSTESLIKKLLLTFSPTHSIILDLKQYLVGLYTEVLRLNTNKNNKKYLTRKLQLCTEILPILEKIEPGISRLAGITMHEMHIPIVLLANLDYDNGDITAKQLFTKLSEAEELLKKSTSYLLYEPAASPEGRLAAQAINQLKLLRNNITNVQQIVTNKSKNNTKHKRKTKH